MVYTRIFIGNYVNLPFQHFPIPLTKSKLVIQEQLLYIELIPEMNF